MQYSGINSSFDRSFATIQNILTYILQSWIRRILDFYVTFVLKLLLSKISEKVDVTSLPHFCSLNRLIFESVVSYGNVEVFRVQRCSERWSSFLGYMQVISDRTKTSLTSTALILYYFHVLLLIFLYRISVGLTKQAHSSWISISVTVVEGRSSKRERVETLCNDVLDRWDVVCCTREDRSIIRSVSSTEIWYVGASGDNREPFAVASSSEYFSVCGTR